MLECKCKGCEERHPGCHSDCPDYILFRKKLEEENKKKIEDRGPDMHYVERKPFIEGFRRSRRKEKIND